MKSQLRPTLVMLALMVVLTGVVYPGMVTAVAQLMFPRQANGSLVMGASGAPVGSALIGQDFTDPRYFWARTSATAGAPYTPYDAEMLTGSSGSNLGPLSADLHRVVEERIAALRAADPGNMAAIPGDLVTASASGLDPSIGLAGALYQAPRVARARGLAESTVRRLVLELAEGRWLGVFGEPRVNVLALNLALDTLQPGVQ